MVFTIIKYYIYPKQTQLATKTLIQYPKGKGKEGDVGPEDETEQVRERAERAGDMGSVILVVLAISQCDMQESESVLCVCE